MKHLLTAAALLLGPLPAAAHDYTKDGLQVIHPVAFETAATARAGAGYMVIANDGETGDRLIEIRADFPRVMLHLSEEADGVATMRHVEAIDIPAGETVALEPGGYHVMFMGLDGDAFEAGEEIPAVLVFERAGEIEIVFKVEARSGEGHEHGHDN